MGDSIFDLGDQFEIDSPFTEWAKQDFKALASKAAITSISFEKDSPDTFDVNKKTLVTFKVDGVYEYWGGDKFDVELIEDEENLVFTTKKWSSVEKGWKLKTYVTVKKSGAYTIQFKVKGTTSNSLALKTNDVSGKSKYKVILMGGVDYYNDGTYGSNYKLGQYLEIIATSNKYNIPLQKGDIQILNSPLFANEADGKDVYKEILEIIKKNFDYSNGTLILYGYSWGGQLLMEFLKFFKESKIKIALLLTVDEAKGYFSYTVNNDVNSAVKNNLNLYQTKFYKSAVWSRGWPNEGDNVKNVNLTGETLPSGEEVIHSNIDDYTLLYCAQVITYALQGIYSFQKFSESEIKKQIKTYASQGY